MLPFCVVSRVLWNFARENYNFKLIVVDGKEGIILANIFTSKSRLNANPTPFVKLGRRFCLALSLSFKVEEESSNLFSRNNHVWGIELNKLFPF